MVLSKLAKDTRKWFALHRPHMAKIIMYTGRVMEGAKKKPGMVTGLNK